MRALLDAIRGTPHDYTSGSIPRGIVLLAVPMMLEMAMESLFAVADVFWVARLGADAIATVGLTESMMSLIAAVAIGLSMSTTALVARRIGEREPEQAAISAVQAIALGIAVSIPVAAAGAWFAPELLRAMGASPGVVSTGTGFTAVMFGGTVTLVLIYICNAAFRGAGDPAIAMRVLWAANLLNIVLGPLLIFGIGPFPRMGVAGSAMGTVVARGAGVLYQFWLLGSGASRVRVRMKHVALHGAVMWRLVRISGTGVLQFLLAHTSWILLIRMVSAFGSQAVAGYTIAMRILLFFLMPAWGISGAAATMVGQNLGAGRPDRAERAVWLTGLYSVLLLGGLGLVLIAVPGPIVRLFTSEPAVIAFAAAGLRLMSYGNPGYAYEMTMIQAYNGAGDTVTPSIVFFLGFWVMEIPLAWGLAFALGWGPSGVFAAIPMTETSIAVAAVILFRHGRWKTRKV